MLRPTSLPHARAAAGAGRGVALREWVTGALTGALAVVLLVGAVLLPTPSYAAPGETSAAAAATPLQERQPLVPRIHSITPDYVPDHGPIVVRGVVTNASDQVWTAINVHAFMGDSAITTTTDLALAAQTPADDDVGPRITVPGTFATIPRLRPGESARFEIRLPRRTLPVSASGVYWFGVHVLGDNGDGAARTAVGRDRTFLTYVPAAEVQPGEHEDAALVVPVRSGVVRGPDGTVIDPEAWGRSLRSGPLHDLVTLGVAAQGRPLTWLLDPAVLDVVQNLARGNPPRTLGPSGPSGRGDDRSPGPSPSDSADPTSDTTSSSGASGTAPSEATRRVARTWLRQLRSLADTTSSQVLGLPYGDLAVESALRTGEGSALLDRAVRRTRLSLRGWDAQTGAAVSPPDGRTTAETLRALPDGTDVLLDDTGVRGPTSTVARAAGHRLVLASSGAAAGGPGPIDPRGSLALRQRILAEAALRLLDDHQPLVVQLPDSLQRRLGASFFAGLDVPWLRLTTVDGATSLVKTPEQSVTLRPQPPEPHLGDAVFGAADSLLRDGHTLQSVLTNNHVLTHQLFAETTGNASYDAAREPYLALARMRIIGQWVRNHLDAIDLAAPPSVTLASTSGRFSALVSNELDVPVKVRVRAVSDARLRITGGGTVELGPHRQTTVFLNASTHQRGVHTVTLQLASPEGDLLPHTRDQFPMRSEQVSGLIWVIIAVGVGLLFAAIVVRLTRRILRERARRRSARAG